MKLVIEDLALQSQFVIEILKDSGKMYVMRNNMTSTKLLCTTVLDETSNDEDICEIFGDKYQTVYNSVATSPTVLNALNYRLKEEAGKQDCQNVSIIDITKLITKLNRGQSDGYKGTKSEQYFLSSHRHTAFMCLCCFSAC